MLHHLYIVLCAYHPKSNLLLSPFIPLYLPFITSHFLPSGNHHIVVCVYKFLFVFLLCSFVDFSFISHMQKNETTVCPHIQKLTQNGSKT